MGIHYTIFLCCFSPELSLVVWNCFYFLLFLGSTCRSFGLSTTSGLPSVRMFRQGFQRCLRRQPFLYCNDVHQRNLALIHPTTRLSFLPCELGAIFMCFLKITPLDRRCSKKCFAIWRRRCRKSTYERHKSYQTLVRWMHYCRTRSSRSYLANQASDQDTKDWIIKEISVNPTMVLADKTTTTADISRHQEILNDLIQWLNSVVHEGNLPPIVYNRFFFVYNGLFWQRQLSSYVVLTVQKGAHRGNSWSLPNSSKADKDHKDHWTQYE